TSAARGGFRLAMDDVGEEIALASGQLDLGDPRESGERRGGLVVGAAEDHPKALPGEAVEQLRRGGGGDEPSAVEDRDVVADALDVVEDVGRVEDLRLAPELVHVLPR